MRRADRLLRIIDILRGGRLVTARELAETLEISQRTVYRDVAHLIGNRVPIEGEAGMGYVMRAGYDLPPIMFSQDEVVALVGGIRLIRAWGGTGMARAAEAALDKIAAVLPEPAAARAGSVHVHAFRPDHLDAATTDLIDRIERATAEGLRLTLDYADEAGRSTRRDVRPLGLWFWGTVWTLVGWCELRDDFRMFRVDRIAGMTEGPPFPVESDKTIEVFRDRHYE
ncbi:helix-turn-helix transcriptional regulator [Jannaschia ovalis]|uniref:YafY family protein n=1 Tax=Jannaschia ovalis TaxID=3038773 RepID=A0ABY8LIA3_9RHOB|nr:YafY family protein [Jannaschia sp. GRR-S6-38]WGH80115.1 YafY family protein [Jannaschia sp. GRR-S6-38]